DAERRTRPICAGRGQSGVRARKWAHNLRKFRPAADRGHYGYHPETKRAQFRGGGTWFEESGWTTPQGSRLDRGPQWRTRPDPGRGPGADREPRMVRRRPESGRGVGVFGLVRDGW